MVFNPTAMKDNIAGGGGVEMAGASSDLASRRLRFLSLLPLEGETWLARYCPIGERQLQKGGQSAFGNSWNLDAKKFVEIGSIEVLWG
jgi:hypothetical protein